jgi:DNA-binding ferritin-like protein (Dps family)
VGSKVLLLETDGRVSTDSAFHYSFFKKHGINWREEDSEKQRASTMAKIIQFPFEEKREWQRVEKRLKTLLQEAQAPEKVIKQVLPWFEGVWFKYREKFRVELAFKLENVPSSAAEAYREVIETAVQETIFQMREVSYEMFGELIAMKIRLEMLKYKHGL